MKLKRIFQWAGCVCIAFSFSSIGFADDLLIYPAKGQSKDQMEKDKFECYSWAKEQTGFDPMDGSKGTTPPPQAAPQGGVVKGAARGALVGVTVGAIAGDAGKGAAIGAASGGLFGGMRKRDQQQQQAQAAQQQAANSAQNRNQYNRAYGACLEGKGYTVK